MKAAITICLAAGASSFQLQYPQHRQYRPLSQFHAAASLDATSSTLNDTSSPSSAEALPRIPLGELVKLASGAKNYDAAVRAAVVAEKLHGQEHLPTILEIWSTVASKLQDWHVRQKVFLDGDTENNGDSMLGHVDLSQVHVYTARDAAMHAESLLSLSNKTSSDAVIATMNCWRNSRDELAPQHVEDLLGDDNSMATFHILLDTYATARNVPNRVETLEALLEKAPQKTIRCYNALLLVYSKMPERVGDAMGILNEMKEKYAATKNSADQPDLLSYSHVMECLAHTETPEAVAQMEELMEELKTMAKTNQRLEPSIYTYATLIKAHARLNQPQQAQAVLADAPRSVMLETAVLHAWSRSRHPEKPVRALKVLQEMKKELQPTTISYNAVIDACQRSKHPASLKIAFAVFQSLEQDPTATPDHWTFVNLLGTIARMLPSPSAERNEISGAVFKKALALQVVHRKVLGKLISVCDSNYLRDLLTPQMVPDAGGRFDFDQIPFQWRKNAPL